MIGPAEGRRGGIRSVVQTLINNWDTTRFPLIVVPDSFEGNFWKKGIFTARSYIHFVAQMLLNKPSIVHIHFSWKMSFWRNSIFVFISRISRAKLILHSHSSRFDVFFQDSGWLGQFYIKCILRFADLILTVSRSWQGYFEDLTPGRTIQVLYNPIKKPEEITVDEKRQKAILFVGHIEERKGIYDLIHTAPIVKTNHPEVEYLIAGIGELEKARELARKLMVQDHVRFLGYIQGPDKEDAFRRATLFCLPSYHEGLPVAILEAMAHGLPIVATEVGGIPEQVTHGVNGFLINPGDIDGLTKKLNELLGDGDMQARMGQQSLAMIEETFEVQAVIENLYQYYENLLLQ
jgi:glycosyltransferase involved in cell wall biosynthesis